MLPKSLLLVLAFCFTEVICNECFSVSTCLENPEAAYNKSKEIFDAKYANFSTLKNNTIIKLKQHIDKINERIAKGVELCKNHTLSLDPEFYINDALYLCKAMVNPTRRAKRYFNENTNRIQQDKEGFCSEYTKVANEVCQVLNCNIANKCSLKNRLDWLHFVPWNTCRYIEKLQDA